MVVEQVTRGRNNLPVNVYRLDVTRDMKERSLDFATRIIMTNNQYSRLLPRQVWQSGNLEKKEKLEIQRTYVGKLGELVFRDLLNNMGKQVDTSGMFEIYEGQDNVDEFDFRTRDGRSVDIKTGFRTIHSRLLINIDQFERIPKDFYVGIWLNGADGDSEGKIIDLDSITEGVVYGYAEHDYLQNRAQTSNFTESPAKFIAYNQLMGIDRLIALF